MARIPIGASTLLAHVLHVLEDKLLEPGVQILLLGWVVFNHEFEVHLGPLCLILI